MRLNPVNVQNVVTYNVVIDVNNPEQKLKPGMTANLTITIDERNNVLKVPNCRASLYAAGCEQANGPVRAAGSGHERPGPSTAVERNANAAAMQTLRRTERRGESRLRQRQRRSWRVRHEWSGCWARTANRESRGSRSGLTDGAVN